ncbi:flagellar basal body P-ring protein FlgI [Desulfatirhabdium butyrativorans]|uniref:flagellar basal body P-ring protein FlgI n=1 Tax=Desulfatirhabdium butyrativorans TaxID=340467 RepID=UPI001FDF00EE|nr:flagellar basal body P-ring protein FlgI [Desulfatirhabdium butyrativorans]
MNRSDCGSERAGRSPAIGALLMGIMLLAASVVHAARIKDIADIQGVRPNQLVGYGLVVGLNGTGDGNKTIFTVQSLVSMLEKMGVTLNANDIKVKNVAAVMVTAEMPPFARAGTQIDVVVSSIGDAKNLQGGTLIFTPLKAANGKIYAVAQGAISTGGFAASGAGGSVQKNFPTVGRVPSGATIEKEMQAHFNDRDTVRISLRNPDFTTAGRMSDAINAALLEPVAKMSDSATVDIRVPGKYLDNVSGFVTMIENIPVTPDMVSKVVVNERTGTVVIGENVRISTVAIAHGNLSISVKEDAKVSQPMPFSNGQTVVTPDTNVNVKEEKAPIFMMESGATIGDIVRALNALGVSPRDLISIFQALQASGALQAKLEIM